MNKNFGSKRHKLVINDIKCPQNFISHGKLHAKMFAGLVAIHYNMCTLIHF